MTDRLDNLLKDWSLRQEPDEESRLRLERRMTMKIREARNASTAHVPETQAFTTWGRFAWFALGAASALAVVLCSGLPSFHSNGVEDADLVGNTRSVQRLFAEVDRQFGRNLRWIAQADGLVELGIDQDAAATRGEQPFAVHIAVVSRAEDGGEWKKLWASDILTWSDQAIDVAPNSKRDNRVALWVHPVEVGRFAVDTRLALNLPVKIHSASSDILHDGRPAHVATLTVGGKEYRVYQTVKSLARGEKGPC